VSALESVLEFGAEHAAASVVGPEGPLQTVGELSHPFPLASVTKLFTAYAALVGCEEKVVSLDDPAGPIGATFAHLLSHASGLSPSEPHRVLAEPGRRRIYSNAGFELLAGHVSQRAAVPFADYLSEAVFEPLGMRSAVLTGSPASGGVATLADCVSFACELLSPSLLDEATFRQATTVAFPGLAGVVPGFGRQNPCDWGLGFELRDRKAPHWTGNSNAVATFGHFGQSGTFIWVDPARRLALVTLTDRKFGDWAKDAWPALSDAVLAEHGG
jgi:CubicO group peptidase (beta-lactamase class C family)